MSNPYTDSDNYNDVYANETSIDHEFIIPDSLGGERIDVVLAKLLPEYSRSRLSSWIKDNQVFLDGKPPKPKQRVFGGEKLLLSASLTNETLAFKAEEINLNVVYEDATLIVINKPAGLVVHPAAGNWHGTLLNGLLFRYPELSQVPRAGIVHRLDKETSGLMVVARTISAQTDLVRQMQERSVKRIYHAIIDGHLPTDRSIDADIGRDPHNRLRMAVVKFNGKRAITHVKTIDKFSQHSLIECKLETGRTHQIRVHLRHINHPLTGDQVYGNPRHSINNDKIASIVKALNRQALHAYQLALEHPQTHQQISWSCPLPEDIQNLLNTLQEDISIKDKYKKDQDFDEDNYDIEVNYVRE